MKAIGIGSMGSRAWSVRGLMTCAAQGWPDTLDEHLLRWPAACGSPGPVAPLRWINAAVKHMPPFRDAVRPSLETDLVNILRTRLARAALLLIGPLTLAGCGINSIPTKEERAKAA